MRYVIQAFDNKNSLHIRVANRGDHVEYVQTQNVKLLLAGPLINDKNEEPIGTLLVVEADSRKDAETYAQNDPYNKAGLFAETRITAINITVNNLT
jgi:uncharacterized protein YciI